MDRGQNSQLMVLTRSGSIRSLPHTRKQEEWDLYILSVILWIWCFRFTRSVSPFRSNQAEPKLKTKALKNNYFPASCGQRSDTQLVFWRKEGEAELSPYAFLFDPISLTLCSLRCRAWYARYSLSSHVSWNDGVLGAGRKRAGIRNLCSLIPLFTEWFWIIVICF